MRLDSGQIEVIDDQVAEVLRSKAVWERIAIGFNLWVDAREMLMSHLQSSHPGWSKEQVSKEVARRMSHGAI
jgi:hypothetical protein